MNLYHHLTFVFCILQDTLGCCFSFLSFSSFPFPCPHQSNVLIIVLFCSNDTRRTDDFIVSIRCRIRGYKGVARSLGGIT